MAQFDYLAPASVDEAVRALASAPTARVLAGGTDLIVQMRAGRMRPAAVVDVKRVPGAIGVRREADAGIVIDGAGLGSAIAANKVRGARAAMCTSPTLARYSRQHNGANVLALGATLVEIAEAKEIVDTWLSTPMSEARYLRRLLKVRRLEERF